MPSAAITKLADTAERSRAALVRVRDKAKLSNRRAMNVAEILVGAAGAGVLDRKLDKGSGHFEMLGAPATPVLGLGLAIAGLSGWLPEDVAMIGVGLMAGPTYTYVYNKVAPAGG
jgi:hypothetical protein